MGKWKDLAAQLTPVTTKDGREVFVANAAERRAVKNGATVDQYGYLTK